MRGRRGTFERVKADPPSTAAVIGSLTYALVAVVLLFVVVTINLWGKWW